MNTLSISCKHFIGKKQKRKEHIQMATELSFKDLKKRAKYLKKNKNGAELVLFARSIFNSSTWLGNSIFKLFFSVGDLKRVDPFDHLTDKNKLILKYVKENRDLSYRKASQLEIFGAIYQDIRRDHLYKRYNTQLKIPKINSTIVLVSGVFNEMFTNAAFERGAQHLNEKLGIKYFVPKVYGNKSTTHNSALLQKALEKYTLEHPDEKLWIIGFSKGGIDSLHFLKDNNKFANEKIIGVSTIATPILGSTHVDHKLLQFINQVHNFSENELYQYFDKKVDILLKEFQESLSKSYQGGWFKNNNSKLPSKPFYSALALEATWYESHVWMMFTKLFFQSQSVNDGVVDAENALYPDYFNGINLGIIKGHHLIGTRSSTYTQEALLEAHIVYLHYLKKLS